MGPENDKHVIRGDGRLRFLLACGSVFSVVRCGRRKIARAHLWRERMDGLHVCGDTQASALSDCFGLSTHLTKEDGDDGNDDVPKTRGRQSNILLVA